MGNIWDADYQTFLVRLRQARKAAGLTQREAAAALGKRQNYISKSETGERRVDVVELVAFAKLYGCSLEFFVPFFGETERSLKQNLYEP